MRFGPLAAVTLLRFAVAGALLLPALPCARSSPSARIARMAAVAYGLGGLICHQRPDRSFHSCGAQWPVCARCSGLYAGAGLGALFIGLGVSDRARNRWPAWRRRMLLAAAPTAGLWLLEVVGVVDPGNAIRFLGALPLGLMTAAWLGAVVREDLR